MTTTATYKITDGNAIERVDSLERAVELVAGWYDYIADEHRDVVIPAFNPRAEDIEDVRSLNAMIAKWEKAIATACGYKECSGHGNYSVSAADEMGLRLVVKTEVEQLDD